MQSACFGDLTRVFWKKQQFPTRVSQKSCSVSYKSDPQECLAVPKSVNNVWPLFSSACVHSGP